MLLPSQRSDPVERRTCAAAARSIVYNGAESMRCLIIMMDKEAARCHALELSKNLVCLYYSFVATELVLAPNNKCHSVRIRASVTALDRTAVERRCDPLHDVAASPPRCRRETLARPWLTTN